MLYEVVASGETAGAAAVSVVGLLDREHEASIDRNDIDAESDSQALAEPSKALSAEAGLALEQSAQFQLFETGQGKSAIDRGLGS